MNYTRHCLTCGQNHSVKEWSKLRYLDTQCIDGELDERPMALEWRKCTCGNSLHVDLKDPENARFVALAQQKVAA
jgi:hypothetical protein